MTVPWTSFLVLSQLWAVSYPFRTGKEAVGWTNRCCSSVILLTTTDWSCEGVTKIHTRPQTMFPLLGPMKAFTDLKHYLCSNLPPRLVWSSGGCLHHWCSVLSQRSTQDKSIHFCTSLSWRLSAGKLRLVRTGHGDLHYLWTAKRLNPYPLRLTWFSSRFFGGVSKVLVVKLAQSVGHNLTVKVALSKISGLVYKRCKISIFLILDIDREQLNTVRVYIVDCWSAHLHSVCATLARWPPCHLSCPAEDPRLAYEEKWLGERGFGEARWHSVMVSTAAPSLCAGLRRQPFSISCQSFVAFSSP